MRAQPPRLEHRHRRMHAEGARDIAGGRDDAAGRAADDQRLVGKRGVVALLDRGVEGVAIDMGDGERVDFRVPDEARRAAGLAARAGPQSRRGNRGRSPRSCDAPVMACRAPSAGLPAASRHCRISAGRLPVSSAKTTSSVSLLARWSSTPARNSGSLAAARMSAGPMPVAARKRPSRSESDARKVRASMASFSANARVGARERERGLLTIAFRLPFRNKSELPSRCVPESARLRRGTLCLGAGQGGNGPGGAGNGQDCPDRGGQ